LNEAKSEVSGASSMFGIEDKYVALAYLLCIASSLLCVVYGLLNWNRGQQPTQAEDIRWAQEEKHVEEEL
jgi:hypothetical protein